MNDIRFSKIKDLEARGGGFIREEKIGNFLNGEVYTGTAYYNNGNHSDIKVLVLPYGNTRILGSAYNTEECREEFEKLLSYLGDLKNTEEYKTTIAIRKMLNFVFLFVQILLIGKVLYDLATIRPLATVYSIIYFIMEGTLFILVKKIKALVESIY